MDYQETLSLVNDCAKANVLLEKEGYIYIVRERGEGFESKEYVATELISDLKGQNILKGALKAAQGK